MKINKSKKKNEGKIIESQKSITNTEIKKKTVKKRK